MVEAYCVKCKKKGQTMADASVSKTPRGGYMAKGKCPDCGTTMCAMMSEANATKAISKGEAKKAF
jgi:predicted nucleic acid binding AN1-type Zn finger protein